MEAVIEKLIAGHYERLVAEHYETLKQRIQNNESFNSVLYSKEIIENETKYIVIHFAGKNLTNFSVNCYNYDNYDEAQKKKETLML